MLRYLQVGHQLCEAVTTVEVLCVPLLAFVKGRRLAQLSLSRCHLCHRHGLRLQCTASVDLVYVAEHHLQGGAVADDMVDVEEEVEMLSILQQTDMEQPILVDVERHDERLPVERAPIFNFQCSIFNVQCKRLRIVNGLQGVTLLVQFYTGKQRRMRCHSGLNGLLQLLLLERAVEHIEIRKIIARLSLMSDTLYIETVLYF